MTGHQLALLDFIRGEIEGKGVAPTFEEMRAHFGWKSKASGHRLVQQLLSEGKLKRRGGHARGLSIPNASLAGVTTAALEAEMRRRGAGAVALARFTVEGALQLSIYGDGPMRFLVVDERTPGDRVYEVTSRLPVEGLAAMIPDGSPIGTKDDERHQALRGRIDAAMQGRPHLRSVE